MSGPNRSGLCRRTLPAVTWLVLTVFAPYARGNVVGNDLQNFNATTNGLDFVTVQSSETLDPGIFNLGLMVNHAVNSLPYIEGDDEEQGRLKYNDTLTTAELGIGYGIVDDLEIGLSVPRLLHQKVDGGALHGEYSGPGITNIRGGMKYRLFGAEDHGLAAVGSVVMNRVRDNPYVGRDGSNIYIFELAGDLTVNEIAVAANLGYRWRKRGDPIPGFNIRPIGNQIIGSVAVSHLLPRVDTKLILELFGSRAVGDPSTGTERRQAASAELLAGIKHDLTTDLALHAGGGTEVIQGASSPDWRAYAGVNWSFGTVKPRPVPAPGPKTEVTTDLSHTGLRRVHFAFGSDSVPKEAEAELAEVAAYLKGPPAAGHVTIEGHTDSVGNEALNQSLSERRAKAVMRHLVEKHGIPAASIEAVGYGESQPIADNGNYQGRQRNRRVDIKVSR